jgi:hypothetical protein
MAWITAAEACQRLGVSRPMLQKKLGPLGEEGYAKRDGSRWLIRSEGLEAIYDGLTRARSDSPRISRSETAPKWSSPGDERAGLQDQIQEIAHDPRMQRSEAERQIKVLQRRLLELDLAEREGQLVDAAQIRRVVFERGRRVRDLLMGIPVRIAADLAAEDDPAAVSIVLERALVEALGGLSDALQS